MKKLQKEELSGEGAQLQTVSTQSQETDIPAEPEQKELKGKTDEGMSIQNAEWDTVKYECIYCDESIIGRKEFVLHQSSVHKNEVFGCENCVLVYELKEDYDEHVKCHQREKASLDPADKISSSNTDSDRPVDCNKRKDIPELSIKSAKKTKFSEDVNSNLERPVIVETETEGKKYWKCKVWQCKWCNHVATTKQGWKEHVCEQVQQFQCPVCGDHFDSERALQEHQRSTHKEQSRYCWHSLSGHIQKSSVTSTSHSCHIQELIIWNMSLLQVLTNVQQNVCFIKSPHGSCCQICHWIQASYVIKLPYSGTQ